MKRDLCKPNTGKYLIGIQAVCLMLLIAGVLILSGISANEAWAADKPQFAPLNPEFIKYQANRDIMTGLPFQPVTTSDGHGLGYIPPPVQIPAPVEAPAAYAPGALPATFDLRKTTPVGVTPVRNQAGCGSSWTFGTLGSLESHLKYKNGVTTDYSEADISENHGFDGGFCMGGNYFMSTAYMARWGGPVAEADVPYPYWFTETGGASQGAADIMTLSGETPGVTPKYHIQNVYFLPQSKHPMNAADISRLKTAIQTNGAVGILFYWDKTYYNATHYAFYCSAAGTSPNHAVTVVGWNDNYPKTNFNSPQPTGNGAFIIKNSWGTGWGESGYFYLSYYDKSLTLGAQFYSTSPVSQYNRIYQYDHLGWTGALDLGDTTTGWYSNIFMASANAATIEAVSTYTAVANTTYTVYIYSGVTPGSPRSGSLVATKKGALVNPGYHTIPLTAPAAVTANQPFSVVIKITIPGPGLTSLTIPIEYAISGYSTAVSASLGQSFYSKNGIAWNALDSNVCLKAFATK
jgi:C1A family cysteine protease